MFFFGVIVKTAGYLDTANMHFMHRSLLSLIIFERGAKHLRVYVIYDSNRG